MSWRNRSRSLIGVAAIVFSMLVSGCGNDTPDPAGPLAGTGPADDGTSPTGGVVDLGGQMTVSTGPFRLVSSRMLSLGERVWRPDVVAVGSTLFLAHNGDSGFAMTRLDEQLNVIGESTALFGAHDSRTDIRVAADGASGFWYAFETARRSSVSCGSNFLHAARYSVDGTGPRLDASAQDLATGCPMAIELLENPGASVPDDPEAVDDPTPFRDGDRYHIVTRAWPARGSTVQHLRTYDSGLKLTRELRLDTGTALPGRQMSQNDLIRIDGRPYLVAGFATGGPRGDNTSSLYAVPLSTDLDRIEGTPVALETPGSRYSTRVTRAVQTSSGLLINYHRMTVRQSGDTTSGDERLDEFLALYDTSNGFSLVGQVQFQDRTVADNHSSFAVIGRRVYLFHQMPEQTIEARVYELGQQS